MIQPQTKQAYKLLHEGALALSQVEADGMRIDVPYLKQAIKDVGGIIQDKTKSIKSSKIWKDWKKRYGADANLNSGDQLGVVLTSMGFELATTETGKPKTDEAALESVDDPFVDDYLRIKKYEKLLGTYLTGVLSETDGEFLHPSFNLNRVVTYRSSSSNPNFQNQPVRDKEIAYWIRRAFIARKGHVIGEVDYSGVEVRVAACYHEDPNMLKYIHDPSTDMHRDMADQIYMLDGEIPKPVRQTAKGGFVFAEFYGDYYISVTRNLWDAIHQQKLTNAAEVSLDKHLRAKGIHSIGELNPREKPKRNTFEKHIKEVEDDFWNRRFKVYGQWRKDLFKTYLKKGYFDMHTGFRCGGIFKRNNVINYPVQGAAFHCLLWSLIRVNEWLRKNKMKTVIIGQIHDSIVFDFNIPEMDDVIAMARQIMTEDIKKFAPWLIVPLDIEVEIAPNGSSWFYKNEIQCQGKYSFYSGNDNKVCTYDNHIALCKGMRKDHKLTLKKER